jgi:hypothetical protein
LSQPQPDPNPDPAPNLPDGEILELEPCAAAAEPESELSIPADNPLEILCGKIFEATGKVYCEDHYNYILKDENPYKLLMKVELDGFVVIRLSNSRKDSGEARCDVDTCSIFDVHEYRNHGHPFPMKEGITGKQWNAFIVKLMQFIKLRKFTEEAKKVYKKRNKYIGKSLALSFNSFFSKEAFANILAKKIIAAFSKDFTAAISRLPLSKFFAVEKLSNCEKIILSFIGERIASCLKDLQVNLSSSTTASTQEFLKFATIDKFTGDNICASGIKFRSGVGEPDAEEKRGLEGELKRLQGGLEATVRKLLTTTTFDFVTKFDGDDKPECVEEMTILRYFDVLAKQWNEKLSAGGSGTNGALLQRAEAANRKKSAKLLEAFLSPATDESVAEFMRTHPLSTD